MLDCESAISCPELLSKHWPSKWLKLALPLLLCALVVACGSADNSLHSPTLGEASENIVFVGIPQGENPANSLATTTRPEPSAIDELETGTELPEFVPGGSMPNGDIEANVAPDNPPLPDVTAAGCSASSYEMQVRTLTLFNEARAQARSCGTESYPSVPPLTWNQSLAIAASVQSQDMATNNFFSHTGSDGSSASLRVSTAGYHWQTVAENIAGGRAAIDETMQDWLESAGHCRNIMNPAFTEVAVSCAEDITSDYRRYWTNILAAPR